MQKSLGKGLARAHVVIVGAGGIGSIVCQLFVGLGVRRLTVIDPQRLDAGNLNRFPWARKSDVGIHKVALLLQQYGSREGLSFTGIPALVQARRARHALQSATLLVCAANTVTARRFVAALAVRRRVPCIGVGLTDARVRLAGTITAWIPGSGWACQACFLPRGTGARTRRGVVLPTIAAAVAAVGSEMAARVICGSPLPGSLLELDLQDYSVAVLTVRRRSDCSACANS
jgi:molybdopterin/thiamine biosynthesis adenylyltransferase